MRNVETLNPRQRKFCDLIVAGHTAKAAYFEAFPRCRSEKTAETEGCKLLKNPKVSEFVAALRWEVGERSKSALVMDMKERREFLARVIRTALGDIDEGDPLCQSFKHTPEVREIRMPDKLRAIELDAKLAGELKQDGPKVEANVSVTVVVTADKLREIQERKAAALGGVHGRN